jgi:sugar-specific transcriptional regulator TrmB
MDISALEGLGFTKGEVKVYLALLELGNTSTGPLIIKSDVSRSKVYEILERLKEKGLASEETRENTRYFQAAAPDRIQDYLTELSEGVKKKQAAFEQILPQLLTHQHLAEHKQEVKLYVGFEGVRTFFNSILKELKKGDEYLAMTFTDKALENKSIKIIFQKFHEHRGTNGVKARILCNKDEPEVVRHMNYSSTPLYEFRLTKTTLPTGIAIANDVVATFNWGKNPKVFVIISADNARSYRRFFNHIWETALEQG